MATELDPTNQIAISLLQAIDAWLRDDVAELRRFVQQVAPGVGPIQSNTRITDVLDWRSRLRFWRRVRRKAKEKAPPPRLSYVWLSDLVLIQGVELFVGALHWGGVGVGISIHTTLSIAIAVWLRQHAKVTPRGIKTFGDLARYLAEHDDLARTP